MPMGNHRDDLSGGLWGTIEFWRTGGTMGNHRVLETHGGTIEFWRTGGNHRDDRPGGPWGTIQFWRTMQSHEEP